MNDEVAGDEVGPRRVAERTAMCVKFGAEYLRCPDDGRIGISKDFSVDVLPLHGLRHPPEFGETGWYIWTGEYSEADDFFKPDFTAAAILPAPFVDDYLGLAPGGGFCWPQAMLTFGTNNSCSTCDATAACIRDGRGDAERRLRWKRAASKVPTRRA
jgi:hypothetical protein